MFLKPSFAFVLTLSTIQGVLSRPIEDYIELGNEADDSAYSPADLNQMRRFWIRFIEKNYLANTQVPDWLVDEEPEDDNDVREGMSSGGGSGSGRKPTPDWRIDDEPDDEDDYMSSGGGQTNEEYDDTRTKGKKVMQSKSKQKTPDEEESKQSKIKQKTPIEEESKPSKTKQKTPDEEENKQSKTKQKTSNEKGIKPSQTKQKKLNEEGSKPTKTKQKTSNEKGIKPSKTKQKTQNEKRSKSSKTKQKKCNEEGIEQSKTITDKELKPKKMNPTLQKTMESGHSVEEYKDNDRENDGKKRQYADSHQSAEETETVKEKTNSGRPYPIEW